MAVGKFSAKTISRKLDPSRRPVSYFHCPTPANPHSVIPYSHVFLAKRASVSNPTTAAAYAASTSP